MLTINGITLNKTDYKVLGNYAGVLLLKDIKEIKQVCLDKNPMYFNFSIIGVTRLLNINNVAGNCNSNCKYRITCLKRGDRPC